MTNTSFTGCTTDKSTYIFICYYHHVYHTLNMISFNFMNPNRNLKIIKLLQFLDVQKKME